MLHIGVLVGLMLGFDLNIYAVVIANTAFGFIMCVLNARSIRRFGGARQEIRRTFLVPALSSAVMGVVVWLIYQLLMKLSGSNLLATPASILIGAIVYAVLLLLLKGLTEQEILRLPKGRLLVRIAKKMRLLR